MLFLLAHLPILCSLFLEPNKRLSAELVGKFLPFQDKSSPHRDFHRFCPEPYIPQLRERSLQSDTFAFFPPLESTAFKFIVGKTNKNIQKSEDFQSPLFQREFKVLRCTFSVLFLVFKAFQEPFLPLDGHLLCE